MKQTWEVVVFTRRASRAREAQHVAEQAWEQLVAAFENAGDAARSAGRRTSELADEAQSRAGSAASRAGTVAEEARRRASAAVDALAGREAPMRWEWVVGAAVAGLMIGWLAAAGARRAVDSVQGGEADKNRLVEGTRTLDTSASPEY